MLNNSFKYIFLLLSICHFFPVLGQKNQAILQKQGLEIHLLQREDILSLANTIHFFYIQLSDKAPLRALYIKDIHIKKSLQDKSYIISAHPNSLVKHFDIFTEIGLITSAWKLGHSGSSGSSDDYQIYTENPVRTLAKINSISSIGLVAAYGNELHIKCTQERGIKTLLEQVEVIYIGQENQLPKLESNVLELDLSANGITGLYQQAPELNGAGMNVSIKELSFNPDDIDLRGRIQPTELASSQISQHATEMATIIAGAGNSFITGKGVAPAARISSSDFEVVQPDPGIHYQQTNTSVQNHSYGTQIENFYGLKARAFDQSANDNPHLLHVFSSGNAGLEADTSGPYAQLNGFANLTGNFKMAKNILTVGAADSVRQVLPFSSKGPAYDGRVKPELVAFSQVGTSNAAALVSGTSLLLQQAYLEQYGSLPHSALIKALLINGAQDIGTVGVDFSAGFGWLDAEKSLNMLQNSYFISDSLGHGSTRSFPLMIPAGVEVLKISLSWNDPVATIDAAQALVNDLDIVLQGPNGETWGPWVLNTNPDSTSLDQAAIRGEDHINNIEQISVQFPAPGNYSLIVKGHTVITDQQLFHIAYDWSSSNEWSWKYPQFSDHLPYNGEGAAYIRWQSTLPTNNGILTFSLNDGDSWEVISENIDLSQSFFRWNPPDTNAIALLKMSTGNQDFISAPFVLSATQRLRVGYNCEEQIRLEWPPIANASHYQVLNLGASYLEPVMSTPDTGLTLEKKDLPTALFAVQAEWEDGFKALRSPAFDIDQQGADCYFISFFADQDSTAAIFLDLRLGTIFGLSKIHFEREINGTFTPFESLSPTLPSIRIEDFTPQQGLNRYRVRLELDNGTELLSEVSSLYFLDEPAALVFPNPVSRTAFINIFSRPFPTGEGHLYLFDSMGRKILAQALVGDREAIPATRLAPGLYHYLIEIEGRQINGLLFVY